MMPWFIGAAGMLAAVIPAYLIGHLSGYVLGWTHHAHLTGPDAPHHAHLKSKP